MQAIDVINTRIEPRNDAPKPLSRVHSFALGCLVAVVSVAIATAARWLLDVQLGNHLAFLTYFLAVLYTAWRTRLVPSVFALFLGAYAGDFFFVEPRYTWMFRINSFEDQIDLWRYLIIGVATILICESMREAQRRAEVSAELAREGQRQLELEVAANARAQEALQRAHDEMEERVRQRTAELNATNEALDRSNRELVQFAAVASHDLQEPLRKVQAFGDRLHAKFGAALGEQGNEYLERVLSSAARMRKLIDDLLAFSRVTTKVQPFVLVDLTAMARDAVLDLEARIEQTEGRVEVSELPEIEADPMQMRQLMLNLIANGLKFHRAEVPPVVKVSARVVEESSTTLNGEATTIRQCELSIEDNGIGFEPQYVDRIFQVFQRLHGRDEYEGTGIGLAICRRIVERHGGRITATSEPGQGATFWVSLPIQQPVAPENPA